MKFDLELYVYFVPFLLFIFLQSYSQLFSIFNALIWGMGAAVAQRVD